MYIREALSTVGRYRNLWYWLYGAKIFLALVITLPALIIIQADLDHSLFSKALLSDWSLDVIGELLVTTPNLFTSLILTLLFYAAIVFVLKQFLNGGIYGTFWHRDGLAKESFFARCGSQFGTHVKISAGMLLVYLVLLIIAAIAAALSGYVLQKVFPTASLSVLAIRVAKVYFIMSVGVVYSDLVRIRRTAYPEEKLSATFAAAGRFYGKHLIRSMALFLAFFVPFVLLWIFVEGLAIAVTGATGNIIGVGIEFALFQLCSFARTGQSLLVTAALASSYRQRTEPQPISIPHEASIDGATLLP